MTNSIFKSLRILFFFCFSLSENVSKVKLEYRFPLNQRMSKLDWYTCVLILCAKESVSTDFNSKEERSSILWRVRGESSKSRIFRNNSELEFCRKFKSFLIAKKSLRRHFHLWFSQGFGVFSLPSHTLRLNASNVHALLLLLFFLCVGDGKCVICDSYVRPCTLVRICDECNYGSYQGRCVICGGPGVSDAYYCKECTVQEKDVSYI